MKELAMKYPKSLVFVKIVLFVYVFQSFIIWDSDPGNWTTLDRGIMATTVIILDKFINK